MQRPWYIWEDLLAVATAHASLQHILNRLYDQSDTCQAAIDAMLRAGALHAVKMPEARQKDAVS